MGNGIEEKSMLAANAKLIGSSCCTFIAMPFKLGIALHRF